MHAGLTDELIKATVAALRAHGPMVTYVVRNRLNARPVPERHSTEQVRRLLKALERLGLVERAPTSYAAMICWKAV